MIKTPNLDDKDTENILMGQWAAAVTIGSAGFIPRLGHRTYERRFGAGSWWYKASPRTDARISLPCDGIVCTHHVTRSCK